MACFWYKQVCFNKGNGGIGGGISNEKWELRFVHNASQVAQLPIVEIRPSDIAKVIDALSQELSAIQPSALMHMANGDLQPLPTRADLDAARHLADQLSRRMIAYQEELDWRCYRLYGLLPHGVGIDEVEYDELIEVKLGERAFEIVLARRMAAGQEQTTWFERHGSAPITQIADRPHAKRHRLRVLGVRLRVHRRQSLGGDRSLDPRPHDRH